MSRELADSIHHYGPACSLQDDDLIINSSMSASTKVKKKSQLLITEFTERNIHGDMVDVPVLAEEYFITGN